MAGAVRDRRYTPQLPAQVGLGGRAARTAGG